MRIVDAAVAFRKDRVALATEGLHHGPGPRQRIVGGRDLEEQMVRIVLADVETLLHDGLVVLVQRQAGWVVYAWAFEIAGLDSQLVVFAVAVGVDPGPDRIAAE